MDLSDDNTFATTSLQNTKTRPSQKSEWDGQGVKQIFLDSIVLNSGYTFMCFRATTKRTSTVQYTGTSRMEHSYMDAWYGKGYLHGVTSENV